MADIRSLLDSAATYDPNYVYGALLPMRKNKKTKDVELALPGIFKDMAQAVTSPMRALEGKIDPMSPEAVTEAANIAGLLGGSSVAATGTRRMPRGQVNHTVWHGSPHKFDKFDMSKIGTGEGAQAYGHGLYFAENPKVATEYKNKLGDQPYLADSSGAAIIGNDTVGRATINALTRHDGNFEKVAKEYADDPRVLQYLETLKPRSPKVLGGQLYKVDIPDEILPRMLDWDKPLSQQHPDVIQPLKDAYKEYYGVSDRYVNDQFLSNSSLSTAIGGGRMSKGMTEVLKAKGIPGIRYLDGNSRGTGGTSNFVLFDDQLPRIIERNGVPTGLKPWKDDPEALRGMLGM